MKLSERLQRKQLQFEAASGLRATPGAGSQVANPLERVAVRPDVLQANDLEELSPMLMRPVGLALRRLG